MRSKCRSKFYSLLQKFTNAGKHLSQELGTYRTANVAANPVFSTQKVLLRIVRIPLVCGHTGLVLYLARTIVYVRHIFVFICLRSTPVFSIYSVDVQSSDMGGLGQESK